MKVKISKNIYIVCSLFACIVSFDRNLRQKETIRRICDSQLVFLGVRIKFLRRQCNQLLNIEMIHQFLAERKTHSVFIVKRCEEKGVKEEQNLNDFLLTPHDRHSR